MKIYGISIELSFKPFGFRIGRYAPSELRPVMLDYWNYRWYVEDTLRWAIKLDLGFGPLARPVKKPFSKENPWVGKPWFTVRLPIFPLVFAYVAIAGAGGYLGMKSYTVGSDEPWARDDEVGKDFLCPSATVRKDILK